jgi:hypothetical protein
LFSTNFVPSFDPIEWCLKSGLHSGGSNSQPFSYESTALTIRPRLLASLAFSSKSFEFGKIKCLKRDLKKYIYNRCHVMWSLIIYHWPEFTRPISLFFCFVCGSIIHCYNLVDVIILSMSLSDYIRRLLVNTFFVEVNFKTATVHTTAK